MCVVSTHSGLSQWRATWALSLLNNGVSLASPRCVHGVKVAKICLLHCIDVLYTVLFLSEFVPWTQVGSKYWTRETLAGVHAKYRGLVDVAPYAEGARLARL